MNTENASAAETDPIHSVEAVVNPPEPEFVTRWTRDGKEVKIPAADAPSLEVELGLTATQYNLDTAEAEWAAAYAGVEHCVHDTLARFRQCGYVEDAQYDVLNTGLGKMINAYRYLMASVGATLPREALVADLAEVHAEHGNLDTLPGLKKHAPLAAQYAINKQALAVNQ